MRHSSACQGDHRRHPRGLMNCAAGLHRSLRGQTRLQWPQSAAVVYLYSTVEGIYSVTIHGVLAQGPSEVRGA